MLFGILPYHEPSLPFNPGKSSIEAAMEREDDCLELLDEHRSIGRGLRDLGGGKKRENGEEGMDSHIVEFKQFKNCFSIISKKDVTLSSF